MRYRAMKNGDKVSVLGFGAMRFREKNGYIDEEYAEKLLDFALEKGINYFDTAWPYHNGASEPFLGKFFEGEKRKKAYIATKLPHWMINETKDMRDIFEKQLKRLRTDYIDYYLAHAMDINSWNKIKELGACGFFDELKKNGAIRQAGFSFHGRQQDFEEILNGYDWDFCQIQYN
ncbi:MAG TPA: aldo/keto reductase, partial [Firmicutes bacterium]|nr:aldo/keto reductase [Bacillota bacterium]